MAKIQQNKNNLIIEALATKHNRTGFKCGIGSLDDYIKKQARQDVKRRISQVFIATEPSSPGIIAGYYTLSSLSVELNNLPEALACKLPRHPIPAALIGRLAVSIHAQKNGIGKMLLIDAIKRTLAVSEEIAIYAVVVDAINEDAQSFYEQFGFTPLNSDRRLFLPLKSL